MRSQIAKKILSETPQETRDFVRSYGNEILSRHLEIRYFILTKEQTEYYLNVGREIELNKWKNENHDFKARNAPLEIKEK